MQLDRELMAAFVDGRFQERFGSKSCLWRFYGWQPHAITVGYNQKSSALDEAKCQVAGIDVVRRPTGGRAVLHAEEFTYSFFADSPESNETLYQLVHEVIRQALAELQIEATFSRSTLSEQPSLNASVGAVSCFTASARYELQVHGRKLVGSAQRRSGNVLLQHGSLPLSARHKMLSSFLALPESNAAAMQQALDEEMARKTTSLEELLGYQPSFSRMVELMQCAAGAIHNVEAMALSEGEIFI